MFHFFRGLITSGYLMGGIFAENGGFGASDLRVCLRPGSMRRFWSKVRRQGQCWLWRGAVSKLGYPVAKIAGIQGGHRVAWVWKHGTRPRGCLRNKCGELSCVNPAHWRDDVKTNVSRMRERHDEIRRLFVSGAGIGEIMDRVGCSRATVWRRTHGLVVETACAAEEGAGEGG